jgi:hypothetical protein
VANQAIYTWKKENGFGPEVEIRLFYSDCGIEDTVAVKLTLWKGVEKYASGENEYEQVFKVHNDELMIGREKYDLNDSVVDPKKLVEESTKNMLNDKKEIWFGS